MNLLKNEMLIKNMEEELRAVINRTACKSEKISYQLFYEGENTGIKVMLPTCENERFSVVASLNLNTKFGVMVLNRCMYITKEKIEIKEIYVPEGIFEEKDLESQKIILLTAILYEINRDNNPLVIETSTMTASVKEDFEMKQIKEHVNGINSQIMQLVLITNLLEAVIYDEISAQQKIDKIAKNISCYVK